MAARAKRGKGEQSNNCRDDTFRNSLGEVSGDERTPKRIQQSQRIPH
jgi:hypothetical protein